MRSEADRKKVLIAFLIVAIMLFPVAAFTGGVPSKGLATTVDSSTITYRDPTGGNSDFEMTYDGIPATEYNPQYWEVADKWVAPTAENSVKINAVTVLITYTLSWDGGQLITINGVQKNLNSGTGYWKEGSKGDVRTNPNARDITIQLPEGVKVPNYAAAETSNPVAMDYDFGGQIVNTGKNENRFLIGSDKDANCRFSITYHYHGEQNKVYLRVNTMMQGNDNKIDLTTYAQGTTITCGFYIDVVMTQESEKIDTGIKQMVFDGWEDESGNLIYPGDVVQPKESILLKAKWVFPDIYAVGSDVEIPLTTGTQVVSIVKPEGGWGGGYTYYASKTIKDFSESLPAASLFHEEDGVYTSGGSGDMLRFTYYLEPDIQDGEYVITISDSHPYYGTYHTSPTILNEGKKVIFAITGSMTPYGDVVFDNIILRQVTKTNDRLGQGSSSMISANNHRLIMGVGIETETPSAGKMNIYYAPSIYGRGSSSSISTTTALDTDKPIVSGIPGEGGYTVTTGTYIIIHSGTYAHLSAGMSAGKNSEADYRSTYMVIKKATVIGIVSGAGGPNSTVVYGGNTENCYKQGGTFVYAIGLKMVGDRYEDTATGVTNPSSSAYDADIKSAHDGWQIDESSMLQGSSYNGKAYGSTHVFLSGNSSVFEVAAGGRNAVSYSQNSYLEITGKAMVRHLACGTIVDGSMGEQATTCVGNAFVKVAGDPKIGTLLGGGYDTWFITEYSSMFGGSINIEVAGGTIGYIYGGGMRGSIGTEDNPTSISISITGGKILKDVYGGGRGGLDKVHHLATNATPTGSLGRFDGKTNMGNEYTTGYSKVYGDINITIDGATIYGDVYGGGESIPAVSVFMNGLTFEEQYLVADVAEVIGTTSVTVSQTGESSTTIYGNVYGAGKGLNLGSAQSPSLVLEYVEVPSYAGWPSSLKEIPYYSAIILMVSDAGEEDECRIVNIPWTNVTNSYIDENGKGVVEYHSSDEYYDYAALHGKSQAIINGGTLGNSTTDSGYVYGGGSLGVVYDDTENPAASSTLVRINGGTINGSVFAGGLGTDGRMAVESDRFVYITGGEIVGDVYGGSRNGFDGRENEMHSNSQIVISNGIIQHSIFGGGLMGKTYGNTEIYVGYALDSNGIPIPAGKTYGRISADSVYAGGNINISSDDPGGIAPYTSELVLGTGTIRIYGDSDPTYMGIHGSIMGSGNSCNTRGDTDVEILNFNNGSVLTGIHRITDLKIVGSTLKITGRNPLTDIAGQNKDVSIFKVEHLTLQNETSIAIDTAIDDVWELNSLNKDGSYATVKAPSNRIVFATGTTAYIRQVEDDRVYYGPVSGFATMTVTSIANYGAYAMANTSSMGGFTITQEGSFREADSSTSGDVQCWYISGIEKKIVTVNVAAEVDGHGDPVQVSQDTYVDILKLQQDTSMMYMGGIFTSVSSDPNGNEYSFVRPGTPYSGEGNEYYAKFGFAMAYKDDRYSSPTLFDPTIRSMDVGDGTRDQMGTFFSTDTYSEEMSGGVIEQRKLIGVDLEYLNSHSTTGMYRVNMTLIGSPVNKTAYVGYLTLNFQEVIRINYESMDDEGGMSSTPRILVTNKIEVRVDIYVYGTSESNSYSVLMKTNEVEDAELGTVREGVARILIPDGFTLRPLYLTGTTVKIADGSNVTGVTGTVGVKSVSNADNTVGWATIASTQCAINSAAEDGHVSCEGYAGTLLGSLVATVEYDISKLKVTYGAGESKNLTFTVTLDFRRGESTDPSAEYATVILKFKDKDMYVVSYRDHGVWTDIEYEEGTELTRDMCKQPSGMNFNGWYLDEEYINRYDYNLQVYNNNLKLYARYTYVVTFDNMNGTYSEMHVAEKDKGALLNKSDVPKPTYSGYEFKGWYTDPSLIYEWDYLSDRVTDNITLYAKWVGLEVRVHFWYFDAENNNELTLFGGVDGSGDIIKVTAVDGKFDYSQTYEMNDALQLLPTVKYGSTFSTVDPWHGSTNILDFAQNTIANSGGFGGEFVRWQVVSPSDSTKHVSIYKDTVVGKSNVILVDESVWKTAEHNYSLWQYYTDINYFLDEYGYEREWSVGDAPETIEIDLVAVTTSIAVTVQMLPNSQEPPTEGPDPFESAITIEAPTHFYSYPISPNTEVWKTYMSPSKVTKESSGEIVEGYSDLYFKDSSGNIYRISTAGGVFALLDTEGHVVCEYDKDSKKWIPKEGSANFTPYDEQLFIDDYGNLYRQVSQDVYEFIVKSKCYCVIEESEVSCIVEWEMYYIYTGEYDDVYHEYVDELGIYYDSTGSGKLVYDNAHGCFYCYDIQNVKDGVVTFTIDGVTKTYGVDKFGNLYNDDEFADITLVYLTVNEAGVDTEYRYIVKWDANGNIINKYKETTENTFVTTEDSLESMYLRDTAANHYTSVTIVPEPKNLGPISIAIEGVEGGNPVSYTYDRFNRLYLNGTFDNKSFVYRVELTEMEYIATWSEGSITGLYVLLGDTYVRTEDEQFDDCYLKDINTGKHYQYADLDDIAYLSITEDIKPYYTFMYKLNGANRNGYVLKGWHNDYVSTALTPSAGLVRTLKISVDDNMKVTGATLYTKSNEGVRKTITLTGYPESYLKRNSDFTMTYRTSWTPLQYNVSVTNPVNGVITAFLIKFDESGNEVREQITDWSRTFLYGDRIEISYAPNDSRFQFGSWVIVGEYETNNTNEASMMLVVQGDCSISVVELSDAVIEVLVNYDEGHLDARDEPYTSVYLHDKETDEYYHLSKVVTTPAGVMYRAKVPLSESYETCIRYGWLSEDYEPSESLPAKLESFDTYDEYAMVGNVAVRVGGETYFMYTVISARFIDEQTVMDYIDAKSTEPLNDLMDIPHYNETEFPNGYRYPSDSNHYSYPVRILDSDGNVVAKITKYVGIQEPDLARAEAMGKHINAPDGPTPPVKIAIEPGYGYLVYEGFPDTFSTGDKFLIAQCNLYMDKDSINDYQATFYLNWVKNDKPADIIIHLGKNSDPTNYINVNETQELTSYASGEQIIYESGIPNHYVVDGLGRLFINAEHQNKTLAYKIDDGVKSTYLATWDVSTGKMSTKQLLIENEDGSYTTSGDPDAAVSGLFLEDKNGKRYDQSLLKYKDLKMEICEPTVKYGLTLNAGNYVGEFTLKDYNDYDPKVKDWEGTAEQIKIEDGKLKVSIPEAKLGSTITLAYDKAVANVVVNNCTAYDDKASVGESYVLPLVDSEEHLIKGWTITCAQDSVVREAKELVGIFFYDVVSNDVGKTLTFSPLYESQITLTFVTSVGQFDNGYQRISYHVNSGLTAAQYYAQGLLLEIKNFDTTIPNYTFGGFYCGEFRFDSGSPITESMTFVARWTTSTLTFTYSKDSEDAAATAIKGSSTLININESIQVQYMSDITITIQPGTGRILDSEKTRGELGYTLVTSYVYAIVDGVEKSYQKTGDKFKVYVPETDEWVDCDPPASYYYKTKYGSVIEDDPQTTLYRYESGWKEFTVSSIAGSDGPFIKLFVCKTDSSLQYKVTKAGDLYKKVGSEFVEQYGVLPGFCRLIDGNYYLYGSDYECSRVGDIYYTRSSYYDSGNTYFEDNFGNSWTKEDGAFNLYSVILYTYNFKENKEYEWKTQDFTKFRLNGNIYTIEYDSLGAFITVDGEHLEVYCKDKYGSHFRYNGEVEVLYVEDPEETYNTYYVKEVDGGDFVKYLYINESMSGDPYYKVKANGDVYHGNEKVDVELLILHGEVYYPYVDHDCTMVSEQMNYRMLTRENGVDYYRDSYGNIWNDWLGNPKELTDGRGYVWTFFLMDNLDLTIYTEPVSFNLYFVVNGEKIDVNDTINRVSTLYEDPDKPDPYGQNIEQYYVVAFNNFKDNTNVKWYTDPAFENEYTAEDHRYIPVHDPEIPFDYRTYQFFAVENLTLYAHTGTYVVYTHDYDNTASGTKKYELRPDMYDQITLPEEHYEKDGCKFIGWALYDEELGKRVFTYAPGEKISASLIGADTLDIYAYYIIDGSQTIFFDGTKHKLQMSVADSELLSLQKPLVVDVDPAKNQVDLAYDKDNPIYSPESGESESPVEGEDVGEYIVYYCGVVKTPLGLSGDTSFGNTEEYTTFWGSAKLVILRSDIYVVAPTMYKEYDGTALTVTDEDIQIKGPDEASLREHVHLVTGIPGHGVTITNPGILHTRAVLDEEVASNYNVHYVEGALVVYTDSSIWHEYQGITEEAP